MVKVAENRVVDLDVFPGNPKGDKLAEQTKSAIAGKIPQDQAQGVSSNTQSAVQALGGTVGGGVKGLVDTVGNTVGALGEGVTGTVQGVGDGVGSTVQFAGGALGAGAGKVGSMFSGNKQGGTEEAIESQKQRLQEATKSSKDIGSEEVAGTSVEEHSKDAMAAAKETTQEDQDTAGGLAEHGDEQQRRMQVFRVDENRTIDLVDAVQVTGQCLAICHEVHPSAAQYAWLREVALRGVPDRRLYLLQCLAVGKADFLKGCAEHQEMHVPVNETWG
ncbi:hypothetical protein LTR72_006830 [Exophiala xenobiotica]|nr:hypothetical protein LTR72_006830 [Exophiala xenobiotica]KAK5286149.1 hypothetical protein LTR14_010403 [Exophiala xenobiotica]KAK5474245.1 hypothetical protein LTR55_010032 [Exophiala xenobiotica]